MMVARAAEIHESESEGTGAQRWTIATLMVLYLGLVAGTLAQSVYAARLTAPVRPLAIAASLALLCTSLGVAWYSRNDRWRWFEPGWQSLAVAAAAAGFASTGLAIVLLAVPTPVRPEALASANFLLLVVAIAIAAIQMRPVPRVLVVGDREFHDHVVRVAQRSRRRIVAWVEPLHPAADRVLTSEEPPTLGASYDEVVIRGDCFEHLRDVSPTLRVVAYRTLVLFRPRQGDAAPKGASLRAWTSFFDGPIPVWGRVQKRLLDLAIGSIALLVASPLLLAAIIAIVLDGPGAPIFRQERLGLDGRRFTLYKLRTMTDGNSDAEHREYVSAMIRGRGSRQQGLYKLATDQRITRVGKVLRHFSIDELPQLWNVLRGEMSLVGPRPPLASETELYDAAACQRLRVKPGLTGLWQVSGRSELGFEQMISLDARYWQSWTPLLDLIILLRTPWVVVTGRGAA